MDGDRFIVSRTSMGIVGIIDRAKADTHNTGLVALFFRDPQSDQKARLMADICAKALNDEAARRARGAGNVTPCALPLDGAGQPAEIPKT
jgi:hypothetical protein